MSNENKLDIIEFYSRSSLKKPMGHLKRRLSNFHPVDIDWMGRTYPSIEHAFQSAKFMYTTTGYHSDLVDMFTLNGDYGNIPANKVRGKGGVGNFKKLQVSLDLKTWNEERDDRMRELVQARWDVDEIYRKIIRKAVQDGTILLHYERPPRKGISYWGGYFPKGSEKVKENWVGENMLGVILIEQGNKSVKG